MFRIFNPIVARQRDKSEPGGVITHRFTCQAVLFDLDGVLVDSRRSIELIWERWAIGRGIDPAAIISVAHGRRTSETIREIAPHLNVTAEVAILDRMEEEETRGVAPVPGATDMVSALPLGQWAIVTSGSPQVAMARMRLGRIPAPHVLVTARDVLQGKPSPEGYLLAAARLGVLPADCIVVEDAPAGVRAGKAAGMPVIALQGTQARDLLVAADAIVPALTSLVIVIEPSGILTVSAEIA